MNDACLDGTCTGDALDADSDGFIPESCGGADCNDGETDVNPDGTEGPMGDATWDDNLDNDCDGDTDANDPDCQA